MLFDSKHSCCKENQRIVVSKEKGNQHILTNKSQIKVFQFRIDGGINKTNIGEKCDYIVEAETLPSPTAFIIELKGHDLNKAISQIQSTMSDYKVLLSRYIVMPRIVIHRTSTHAVRGKKFRDFKKQYPKLIVKDIKYDLDCV